MVYNLDTILLAYLGSQDLVDKWWNTPHAAFGFATAQQLFNSQDTNNIVVNYILALK